MTKVRYIIMALAIAVPGYALASHFMRSGTCPSCPTCPDHAR